MARPEKLYPLKIWVCDNCWLVQTEDYAEAAELFASDYAYFSSTSISWLEHAKNYVTMIQSRLRLDENSFVLELACNDGYLLKNFIANKVPCLGIEPTDSTAAAAEKIGVSVLREFFGEALGKQLSDAGQQADLIVGNNVYAHVPDINDFTRGIKAALKPSGTVTLEFPHLLELLEHNQFDTVYHEHFSYLSLTSVSAVFEAAGLMIYDVEQLPTHGGSLRVYGCHIDAERYIHQAVADCLATEHQRGLTGLDCYLAFQQKADAIRDDFLSFLQKQKTAGKKVVAYGAAAKGNTLLNYAGVTADLLPVVYDAAPSKQGKHLPGSHIPIEAPAAMANAGADYVIILPWNIADEVVSQYGYVHEQGGHFVTAIPRLRIF